MCLWLCCCQICLFSVCACLCSPFHYLASLENGKNYIECLEVCVFSEQRSPPKSLVFFCFLITEKAKFIGLALMWQKTCAYAQWKRTSHHAIYYFTDHTSVAYNEEKVLNFGLLQPVPGHIGQGTGMTPRQIAGPSQNTNTLSFTLFHSDTWGQLIYMFLDWYCS